MPTQIPAFLQQPQLLGLVQSYPIDTRFIGSRWFPFQDVASDELLINIEVPEVPIAPFITLDQEAPRDQRELLTRIRTNLAYIRFKHVFQESELRIFGERTNTGPGTAPTLVGQMQSEARAKILRHIARLRMAVDARLEWLAINAMTGSISYDDERIKFAVNFPGIYTGGATSFTKWDQNNSNPIADLNRWIDEISDVTSEKPVTVLASNKVWRTLAENDELKDLFTLWRGGGNATTVTRPLFDTLLNDWFGLERIDYNARLTTRTYNSSGTPTVVQQRILSDKHIVLLPPGPLGTMATSPNPIDFGGTGLYAWTQSRQDPWVVENGVGINAFPSFIWPERVGYIQVLT